MRVMATLRRLAQLAVVLVGSTFLLAMLLQLLPVGLEELFVVSFDEASRQQQLERLRLDRNPVLGTSVGYGISFVATSVPSSTRVPVRSLYRVESLQRYQCHCDWLFTCRFLRC